MPALCIHNGLNPHEGKLRLADTLTETHILLLIHQLLKDLLYSTGNSAQYSVIT